MSQKLQPIRGTKDILPEEFQLFRHIHETARTLGERYGFREMAVPILEFTEVYKRTIGEATDIVSKEMYTFKDRGDEEITMRPEFTAGVARAFITHSLQQQLPQKLFCAGPLFRYERPQKGRQRQFHQINFECIGWDNPLADLEIISLAARILNTLRIPATLEINSLGDQETRASYRDALVEYLSAHKASLSEESQRRLEKNPLRILDSKNESDRAIIKNAPTLEEHYSRAARDYFHRVLEGLHALGISYTLNPYLVRGIDYYSHTIFEFTSDALGAQNTVLAGGRYDQLIETMGGTPTPAIGFAGGMERLMALSAYKAHPPRPVCILPLGDEAEKHCITIAEQLREKEFYVEILANGAIGKRMKKADEKHAHCVLILGDEELKNQQITLKNLDTGQELKLTQNRIVDALRSIISPMES